VLSTRLVNRDVFLCLQPSKKPKVDEVQELLTLYQPPDWLICTVNRISPYVPQIGDEVRVKADSFVIISQISPKPVQRGKFFSY